MCRHRCSMIWCIANFVGWEHQYPRHALFDELDRCLILLAMLDIALCNCLAASSSVLKMLMHKWGPEFQFLTTLQSPRYIRPTPSCVFHLSKAISITQRLRRKTVPVSRVASIIAFLHPFDDGFSAASSCWQAPSFESRMYLEQKVENLSWKEAGPLWLSESFWDLWVNGVSGICLIRVLEKCLSLWCILVVIPVEARARSVVSGNCSGCHSEPLYISLPRSLHRSTATLRKDDQMS